MSKFSDLKAKLNNQEQESVARQMKLLGSVKYRFLGHFNTGLALVSALEDSNLYGYIDEKGNQVIPLIYNYAQDFQDDFAIVGQFLEGELSYFYIDRKGKRITENSFEKCYPFNDGFALSKIADRKFVVLNKLGDDVIVFEADCIRNLNLKENKIDILLDEKKSTIFYPDFD